MTSVISQLVIKVREAAVYNTNAQHAPVAILWTDKECQWQSVLPLLRDALPELFVFGQYQPENRTGPSIWLKCVIANQIEAFPLGDDVTPIIYIPGISRSELRAIEQCPDELKPLAELQYRGVLWSQFNGKDWTVNSYLTSDSGGLGLDVAKDSATQDAMLMALETILQSSLESLEGKRLEASDFNQFLSGDPVRDLLSWMNAPQEMKNQWASNRWSALCNIAKAEFGLDIESDGEYLAAEKLCAKTGAWEQVWQRFCDSPDLFPSLPALLERVPVPDLLADPATYPQANAHDEAALLVALIALAKATPHAARKKITELELQHRTRRCSIWSRLNRAPWVLLLDPLVKVATLSESALGGLTPQALGERYANDGWQVDAAALAALALCETNQQRTVIENVLAVIYTPWLAELNERFQQQVSEKGYPGKTGVEEAIADYMSGGELVFFVDGLRLDVAHQLQHILDSKGLSPTFATQWSALPSVTATAKAAVSPIHQFLTGIGSNKDFEPSVKDKGALSHDKFKRLLADHGWQYLVDDDVGDPSGSAWVECGDIDKEGHKSELKLARKISSILDSIVERILELQQAGWRKIRIVTDHGWLLVPGKMPKSNLPIQAADSRWGRCAQLKNNVEVQGLTLGWYWDPNVPIHFPHGIHSFIAGRAYSHGGVSLQECLVPVLTIEGHVKQIAKAHIKSVNWVGLTCKVEIECDVSDIVVDLRTKLADSSSSLIKPKKIKEGRCSLMVLDDDNEDLSAMVVVVDTEGNVLAKQSTTVGGND